MEFYARVEYRNDKITLTATYWDLLVTLLITFALKTKKSKKATETVETTEE